MFLVEVFFCWLVGVFASFLFCLILFCFDFVEEGMLLLVLFNTTNVILKSNSFRVHGHNSKKGYAGKGVFIICFAQNHRLCCFSSHFHSHICYPEIINT